MDTHIAPSPDFDHDNISATARLPGEPDPNAHHAAGEAAPQRLENPVVSQRLKINRTILLSGGAAFGLVVLAGAAFVLSPAGHVVPVAAKLASAAHQTNNEPGIKADRPFAPSASLASLAPPNRPNFVVAPKYSPKPHDQDLSEILAMRPWQQTQPGSPSQTNDPKKSATPAATMPTLQLTRDAATFAPHEPGSALTLSTSEPGSVAPKLVDHEASNDITRSIIATIAVKPLLSPQAPGEAIDPSLHPAAMAAPAIRPTATPASRAADAVDQAAHLQAAPMTAQDQIKVLELVTQMATMVRDLKAQNANLRADFVTTSADDQARLADFARRIDFAEATKAVAAANTADEQSPLLDEPRPPRALLRPAMAFAPIAVTRPEASMPSSAPQEAKHYRVQAASPGLALLTEVARGGGDGAQLQVTVGEVIPGWGRVKSVAQRGISWMVSTEHGVIE